MISIKAFAANGNFLPSVNCSGQVVSLLLPDSGESAAELGAMSAVLDDSCRDCLQSSACNTAAPRGLGEPGGVSRRKSSAIPPDRNLFNQRENVLGEQPTIWPMSLYPCWPVVASRIACSRCLWRTSFAALNRFFSSALRAGSTVSLRRARPMP